MRALASQVDRVVSVPELAFELQLAVCAAVEASFGPKAEYERLAAYADACQRKWESARANAGLSIPGGEPGYAPGNC